MDKFVVRGSKPLSGTIKVGGSKNAALPVMAACILATGKCSIAKVPLLRDIATMDALLRQFGIAVDAHEPGTFVIDGATIHNAVAPYDLVRTMRASFFVLGPLLARLGWARVSLPGGCAIGARPVNLHLDGLRKMGADIELVGGYVEATAENLHGANIYLELPSVGATENVMMAACLADGKTTIMNAAREPEIEDLQRFLRSLGASVDGAGTGEVTIEGKAELGAANHVVIPDRMETGTYLLAALITGGTVTVKDAMPDHLDAVLESMREMGAQIEVTDGTIVASAPRRLTACDITTLPHPGFPTDLQPHIMAALTLAKGTSTVTETVFERRFTHVPELLRMGADIRKEGPTAIVTGVKRLVAAPVMASDLRASAALVLAGLIARGVTTVQRVYHIDRGYEHIEAKLRSLGADIRRLCD